MLFWFLYVTVFYIEIFVHKSLGYCLDFLFFEIITLLQHSCSPFYPSKLTFIPLLALFQIHDLCF